MPCTWAAVITLTPSASRAWRTRSPTSSSSGRRKRLRWDRVRPSWARAWEVPQPIGPPPSTSIEGVGLGLCRRWSQRFSWLRRHAQIPGIFGTTGLARWPARSSGCVRGSSAAPSLAVIATVQGVHQAGMAQAHVHPQGRVALDAVVRRRPPWPVPRSSTSGRWSCRCCGGRP